jgi:hypothetical protein
VGVTAPRFDGVQPSRTVPTVQQTVDHLSLEWPLAERNRILGLLAKVVEGHKQTGRDGVLVAKMPADVIDSIQQTVQAAVTRCPDCDSPMYAGTECGLCRWDAALRVSRGDPPLPHHGRRGRDPAHGLPGR